MPIYEYRCTACGHELEALQKLADAPLTDCPSCGQSRLSKLISAAGFRLKGSGWYATDFKNSSKPAGKADGAKGEGAKAKAEPAAASADSGSAPAATAEPKSASTPAAGGCGGGCSCH